jgi:hypothetical protein
MAERSFVDRNAAYFCRGGSNLTAATAERQSKHSENNPGKYIEAAEIGLIC